MRALRWLLSILASLLLLASLAAWLVPPMLDWTRYRGEIVALASATLGRSMRIDGPISLTLLPQPVLTAASVSVDDADATISMRVLRLRVALGPLLRGEIAARELVMRDFEMHLPWPITTPVVSVRRPDWLAAVSARIEHGRVTLGDMAITDIDADLATGTPEGSYAASGTARLSGQPWHVSLRMTQPGGDGSVGLDVALDGQGPTQGIGATLSAQIGSDGTLGGRVTARGPDLSALLPAPALTFKADGRLTVAGGLAAADDLTVEIGGSPARGAVALRVSPALRLDVALAAGRLDLDAWLPTVLGGSGLAVPTGIDLSAEAAQLAGGTLRQLRGAFDIDRDGVDVRDMRAVLPGEASVQLAGRITHAGGQPHFAGDATLAAPSLRATLGWLEAAGFGAVSALPEGVLRSAELTGHAMLDPGQLALAPLSGRVDSSHIDGSLAIRPGTPLAVGATLRMDRLDLDPWLPDTLPTFSTTTAKLAAMDADLRLDAGHATVRGMEITPFVLDAVIDGGQLALRRLQGQSRDVEIVASGALVAGGRLVDGRLDLRASQAAAFNAMLPAMLSGNAVMLRAPMMLQMRASGPSEALALQVAGALGDLKLDAQPTLDLTTGRWNASLTLRHPGAPRLAELIGLAGAPSWLGDGSLALVARATGGTGHVSVEEFDVTAGALHAAGQLTVDTGGPEPHVDGKIVAETLPLPFPFPRTPEPLPLAVLDGWTGSVALEAGRVLAGLSPVAEHVTASLVLADRTLRIDRLSAGVAGGVLTGNVVLHVDAARVSAAGSDGLASPTLSAAAVLKGATIASPIFDLPIDVEGGRLDGEISMRASGYSPAALLASLQGQVTLQVRKGRLAGLDLAQLAADPTEERARVALAGGATNFDLLELTAQARRGSLQIQSAHLVAPSGDATASGTVDLPGESADLRLVIRPAMPDPPEIGLRLTGPIDALQRTPELAGVTTWRLARAAARP